MNAFRQKKWPMSMTSMTSMTVQRGVSLVEILIGMLIGTLVSLAVLQSVLVSGEKKNSTLGMSVGQQNGQISLHLLEKDIKNAGYGIAGVGGACMDPPVAVAGATPSRSHIAPQILAIY